MYVELKLSGESYAYHVSPDATRHTVGRIDISESRARDEGIVGIDVPLCN
jgi:hypothetical protein